MRTFFVGLLCLILPESHREGLVREYGINAPLWSFLLGLVEMPVGFLLYFNQSMGYMSRSGLDAIGWVNYHLTPPAWFFVSIALTGLVRMAAYLSIGEAVGELWAWAAIRAYEQIRAHRRRRRETREFAPVHLPDRAILEEDGRLVIISSRKKEDWDELVTIKVGDRFFQLVGVEERRHGSWKVIAHILEEMGPNEPIRRLLHADVELPRAASETSEEQGPPPAPETADPWT